MEQLVPAAAFRSDTASDLPKFTKQAVLSGKHQTEIMASAGTLAHELTAKASLPSEHGNNSRIKLVIDTDPGVDDAMAILAAFNSPKAEVIGLTTIYGNVKTSMATQNAIYLREVANQFQVPVCEGCHKALIGTAKERVADFVHGDDGFGNTKQPAPKGTADARSAAQFIVEMARKFPGQVTVLALGPLTNLALAFHLDPHLADNLGEIVILGGAFFVNGNVNPAAEANFFGDPFSADFVLSQSHKIRVVGLDVTHQVTITGTQLADLAGHGKYGTFLSRITQFYLQYHRDSYNMDCVFVHDPTALAAVLDPNLFTWKAGEVRVVTDGVAQGHCIMDTQEKNWNGTNVWMDRPKINVAVGVQGEEVTNMMLSLMQQ